MTSLLRILLALLPLFLVCGPLSQARAATKPFVIPPGAPVRLVVSRIHINASMESLAFNKVSEEHAPFNVNDVGWYNRGPRPGEVGRATVFGHLDSTCCPAVFYRLKSLKAGDQIQVLYKTGPAVNFRVMWSADYPNGNVPLKFLFGSTTEHGLNLMTCAGDFHQRSIGYDHKLVVYARLVLPDGKLG